MNYLIEMAETLHYRHYTHWLWLFNERGRERGYEMLVGVLNINMCHTKAYN